ncbi:uncharacterized protein B0H18DRAFT_1009241 [Fomitopsis serialis]|uniref:uncharacterized protein n=1 Tax=Fomitopsis serialis TaxID=139415 RepID=UPI002007D56A|nr:uncharacterized protein B0H18DRAFT_1009241 [Neoantrodia serialis]KAH9925238.1 hypothetical protein B0H18DRAFT_1009241 [Neoantrodia serialis]
MRGNKTVSDGALRLLPEDDRIQLQGCASEQVRDWIASKVLAVQLYLSNLQTVYNSTLSVNTQPNEILVEILCLASASDARNTWITKTMGVCRQWRDLIMDTPLLWTNIDLSARLPSLKLCLSRSSGTSIGVSLPSQVGIRGSRKLRGKIDFPMVALTLAPHQSRITSMNLHVEHNDVAQTDFLWQVLDAPLPALACLALDAGSPKSSQWTLTLPKSLQWTPKPLPSLRDLSLIAITPDWTQLPLSQLTSLTLYDVLFEEGPFASILDLLEACVSLEIFKYTCWERRREQSTACHILSLPRMRHVHLAGDESAGISNLLAQISLARHAHLSLETINRYDHEYNERMRVLDPFLPKDSRYLPAICEVRHLMVWLNLYEDDPCAEFTIYADMERTEFWDSKPWRVSRFYPPSHFPLGHAAMPSLLITYVTECWPYELDIAFRPIIRHLGGTFPESLETLVLRGSTSPVGPRSWARMLGAFPNLKQLEIIGQISDMPAFPSALAPTPTGIPAPHLRELVLQYRPRKKGGSLRMLRRLHAALRQRAEVDGGSRLESLSLLMEPWKDCTLFPPTFVVEQLPAAFKEILEGLRSVVTLFVFRCIGEGAKREGDEDTEDEDKDKEEEDENGDEEDE